MKTLKARTVGELWIKAIKEVYNNGEMIKDGEQNLKELLSVLVSVEKPTVIDDKIKKYGDMNMVNWMNDNFLSLKEVDNWGYSYGQRIYNFGGYYDQFKKTAEKLTKNLNTKSATISFMYPGHDDKHMPCIVAIDFKIRNEKLNGNAFFRSQDVGKKFYADIICMGEIIRRLAETINMPVGKLDVFIASLHIYENDFGRVLDIIK
jgi:thymidylate synthase